MKREPPLVKVLPREPGTKEARYVHLLSGSGDASQQQPAREEPIVPASTTSGSIAHLEDEIAALRDDVAELRRQLDDFRKQFQ
jgi:uncharacterized protein YceH (UPF0502 family)